MKKLPTINIRGNEYTLVKDRVLAFNGMHPNGSIQTEIISDLNDKMVVVRATVIPDCKFPERKFSDYSQSIWGEGMINKTSALENASTSAVGRALAMLGIGVIESIASVDEINKAQGHAGYTPKIKTLEQITKKSEKIEKKQSARHDAELDVVQLDELLGRE